MKAKQLRMVQVAASITAKHSLGKQSLTPKRNKTFGVKIFWM